MTKVAIVTGASRGIGAEIAKRLAGDGFAVIVNYSSSEDEANQVVSDIEKSGGTACAVKANIADPAEMKTLFDEAERLYGGVDVLVNNAGVMGLSPIAQADDALFEKIMNVNVKGVFNGMREAANRLRGGGRIVSFSTSVVGTNFPAYGLYAASKAAVETMTRILAKELGGRQITVNAIAPGPVATELFMDGKDEATIARIASMIPLGRLGQVDDIAAVASFLASDDARWVNGQVLRANGGMV